MVAASKTAAPPVSVRKNSRSGVSRLRAHAVFPENGDAVRPLGTPLLLVVPRCQLVDVHVPGTYFLESEHAVGNERVSGDELPRLVLPDVLKDALRA